MLILSFFQSKYVPQHKKMVNFYIIKSAIIWDYFNQKISLFYNYFMSKFSMSGRLKIINDIIVFRITVLELDI